MEYNPPAFPFAAEYGHPAATGGMTLRDWFAGQALNVIGGMYASGEIEVSDNHHVANMAYSLADAMLAERERDQ